MGRCAQNQSAAIGKNRMASRARRGEMSTNRPGPNQSRAALRVTNSRRPRGISPRQRGAIPYVGGRTPPVLAIASRSPDAHPPDSRKHGARHRVIGDRKAPDVYRDSSARRFAPLGRARGWGASPRRGVGNQSTFRNARGAGVAAPYLLVRRQSADPC